MNHFEHPGELTEASVKAINLLHDAGVIMTNQTPMLRGVNDKPGILKELFEKLSFIGVPPYYLFQCRPAAGNKMYSVPIEKAYDIFNEARNKVSGLAARAKYVMSHATGKIGILGKTKTHIIFRYHRAAKQKDQGKLMVFKRNRDAYWFDDYLKQDNKHEYTKNLF